MSFPTGVLSESPRSEPPLFVIIAGANGVGKSTFARRWIHPSVRLIDPDAIGASPIAAGRQALDQLDEALKRGEPVAIETTLAGTWHLSRLDIARQLGYERELLYLTVPTVELSIARVADRVARGGHNVPEPDIRRRFQRSHEHLSETIAHVDFTAIFNAEHREYQQCVLQLRGRQPIWVHRDLPQWIQDATGIVIPEHVREEHPRAQIRSFGERER